MDSFKLKEERSVFVENMEAILEVAKSEDRDLTDDEQKQWEGFDAEIESIDKKIAIAERQEHLNKSIAANLSATKPTKEKKELKDYSFQDAMKQSITGRVEGLVKEMDAEARLENPYQSFRGVAIPRSVLEYRQATTSSSNPTEVQSFTDQLQANLVLASAGANFYAAVADQKFPIVQNISSTWAAETGDTVSAAGDTTSLTLSPKKLISIVQMSAEALTQNAGLEGAIRRNMAASIASTLETALLTAGADDTNAPASIFTDAAAGSTPAAGAVATSDFVSLETTVLGNNVPLEGARMAYILDATAYNDVKGLSQISNVSALWDNADKRLNSYFGFFSTNVGNGGTASRAHALFGDFSRVHIAQFGGLDMLFDPYTNAASGLGRIIATSLVDGNATDNATAFASLIEAA